MNWIIYHNSSLLNCNLERINGGGGGGGTEVEEEYICVYLFIHNSCFPLLGVNIILV